LLHLSQNCPGVIGKIKSLMRKEALFLFAGLLLFAFAVILLLLPVDHLLNQYDTRLLYILNGQRLEMLDPFWIWVSKTTFYISFSIPLGLFLYSLRYKLPALRMKSYFVFLSWAISVIILNILKHTIDRPRPFRVLEGIEKLSAGGSPSFPSGHTLEAFTVISAVLLLFAVPRWLKPVLVIWALMVAYTRICLGVHYPSDVLAGIGLGIFISCSTICFFVRPE
jgi:membrane-associated phospholipid phosphatase